MRSRQSRERDKERQAKSYAEDPVFRQRVAEAEAKGLGVTTHVGGEELQLSHAGKRVRSNSSDESVAEARR